jgi:hypothetical protein
MASWPMNQPSKRGGARVGSGRKKLGRKPFIVRMNPETMRVLRARAAQIGKKHAGEVLEHDYDPNNRIDS